MVFKLIEDQTDVRNPVYYEYWGTMLAYSLTRLLTNHVIKRVMIT